MVSQGVCTVQLCSLTPALKHLLKTFENVHTMEKCLVWHPIIFPQNSRLLEWKLTAPTFNISQFLTLHIMLPNKYGQPPFLLGFVIVKQIGTQAQLWMVEFLLFCFRKAYMLFVIKFNCPDRGETIISYCYIRDDLFRTQILHKSLGNIFYMIQST